MRFRLLVALLTAFTALAAVAGPSFGSTRPRSIDLATGLLGAHQVIGRSVAGVVAVLGAPDQRIGGQQTYTLRYEPRSAVLPDWGLQVVFRREYGQLRAWSIVVVDPQFRDAKLGALLRLTPNALQKAVLATYGDRFALVRAYRCTGRPGSCRGELGPRGEGRYHLGFGLIRGAHSYLVLYA
jgi:hypothetical protein